MVTPSNEATKPQQNQTKLSDEIQTERYKYVLAEIHALNENVHRYLSLFQALSTAVIGASVAVFVSWRKLDITAEIAREALQGLVGLIVILSLFTVISIFVGILSWIDYRREEVELLNAFVGAGFRKLPSITNAWRWNETWIIIFVAIISAAMVWFAEERLICLLR